MKRKIIYIILVLIIVINIIWIGMNAYCFINLKRNVTSSPLNIKLNGNSLMEVLLNEKYVEEEGVAYLSKEKMALEKSGEVDVTVPGEYLLKYSVNIDNVGNHNVYRVVKVVDKMAPVLTLKGKQEMSLYVGEKYVDPGFKVTDDSGVDLTSKVVVTGKVDYNKVGTYEIVYSVVDDSGNKTEVKRKVTIKNRPIVTTIATTATAKKEKGDEKTSSVDLKANSNTTISMKFTNNGIHIEGYVKNGNGKYAIKMCKGNDCKETSMKAKKTNYYSGDIKLSDLANGTYKMKVVSGSEMDLINKLSYGERINRAKVGDKLVTFSYDKDKTSFKVEDFAYQYDILIDAGHGGSDSGATNKKYKEKDINLEQSKYEKMRYEQHGLKVLMVRTNDTYGNMMGPTNEANVRRRAYYMGYYGAVSRYVYSNHHNSIGNNYYSGWEIILPAALSSSDSVYKNASTVSKAWTDIYPVGEKHLRFYTRNYESGSLKDKSGGQTYTFRNYYAILRLTYELYNVNTILYEGSYMSNSSDFDWYYTKGNWKDMSEAKIKVYVESLGKTYVPPTQ